MNQKLEFSDLIGVLSLYLGIRNLNENEVQSDAQMKLLRDNDVQSANDKQAQYLLEELGRKFDEQNQMLKEILEKVGGNNGTIQTRGGYDGRL